MYTQFFSDRGKSKTTQKFQLSVRNFSHFYILVQKGENNEK
jgi:hypothetical protein